MFIGIWKDSYKYYCKDRKLIIEHNEYGSAYIFSDNFKTYRINNKLHNPHGPAVIYSNGTKSYYLNNKHYSYNEWLEQINKKE